MQLGNDPRRAFIRARGPAYRSVCLLLLTLGCSRGTTSGGNERSLEWHYVHDQDGRITEVVDPGGKRTRLGYEADAEGRVRGTRIEAPGGGPVQLRFGSAGRLEQMTDARGATTYEYDALGHPSRVKGPLGVELGYRFDPEGRLLGRRLGDWQEERRYDFLGRVSAVESPAGAVSYDFDSAHARVLRTLPGGVSTTWQFGADGRLQTITHADGGHRLIAEYAYQYRADGLVAACKEVTPREERVLRYDYDQAHRLTAVADSRAGTTSYRYDETGNRTETVLPSGTAVRTSHDWAGRATVHNGKQCRYDGSGNLIALDGVGTPLALAYDGLNRLAALTAGKVSLTYDYDGAGRLAGRTRNGVRTDYVPDPFAEPWLPLSATRKPDVRQHFLYDGDLPLAQVGPGGTRFFLHDQQGSTRLIVDAQGNVLEHRDYDVFGTPERPIVGEDLEPAFAGMFFEPAASVYLTRARAYHPELGSFLQVDPKQDEAPGPGRDLSLYAYAAGDPVNRVDRAGTQSYYWNNPYQPLYSIPRQYWYAGYDWQGFHREAISMLAEHAMDWETISPRLAMLDALPMVPAPLVLGITALHLLYQRATPPVDTSISNNLRSFAAAMANDPYHLPSRERTDAAYDKIMHFLVQQSMNPFSNKTLLDVFAEYTPVSRASHLLDNEPSLRNRAPDGLANVLSARYAPPPPPPGGALSPAPVGGVYLRGAGDTLKGLGELAGVAIDPHNGRLILLGKAGGAVNLPPLRLDDVVTVFRSVYEQGDAPYVSIDPDPARPMGPVMNIRHGKGTEGTQVGWVLFETDRIMKGYSLGVDNVTREKIETDIPGYTNIFSGGAAAGGGRVWERFWIVPAGVSRFLSGEDDLALLDVPLMVRTEPMVMRSGKLASAPGLQPSPQAKAFAEWFSASYDRIAEEAVSKAPDGNGDVRTFQELRRVALLSAMAESLRDQGVAMPAWMKDYPVSSCTFGTTTPALTVQEKQGRAIRRVYGGVSLSPPDDLVTTKPAAPEASALAASLRQSLKADPLAPAMQLDSGGTTYTASALPGATTRDLGSLRLVATDLRVPVQAGTQIELTRSYDSFFAPADAWQSSWTLDLPVLERVKRPLKRTQNQATYTQAFQLSAPLGGQSAIFAKQEFVPALNGKLLVPTVAGEFLGMSSAADGRIGERTNVVWRRDGSSLHFSADTGRLAAVEQKPLTVIYRRDRRSGHILRIEGWYGKDLRAAIRLAYDQQGRMVKAEGSNGDQVEYGYEPGGGLAQVSSRGSEVGYRYAGSLVTDLLHDGKLQRHFDYDARGRLTKETTESGAVVGYDTRYEAGGLTARAVPAAGGAAAPTVRYDDSFRPVQQIAADGTRRAWQYGRGKGYVLTVTGAGDGSYTETRSEDGLVRQVRGSDGRTVEGQFDSGGHLTGLRVGGEPLLAQEWLADGRLAQVTGVLAKAHPEYDGYGVLKRVVLTGIDQGTAAKRWMSTELNEAGLVSVVTDYSGAKTQIGYDETLQPRIIVSGRGGVELARDEQGRVRSAKTSWDEERDLSYDGEGHVSRARVRRGTETLGIELDRGLPARIVDFDGAETRLAYETGKRGPRLARARTEPGLELVYGYDQEDRLTSVTCGSSYRVRYSYDAGGRLTGLRREAMR